MARAVYFGKSVASAVAQTVDRSLCGAQAWKAFEWAPPVQSLRSLRGLTSQIVPHNINARQGRDAPCIDGRGPPEGLRWPRCSGSFRFPLSGHVLTQGALDHRRDRMTIWQVVLPTKRHRDLIVDVITLVRAAPKKARYRRIERRGGQPSLPLHEAFLLKALRPPGALQLHMLAVAAKWSSLRQCAKTGALSCLLSQRQTKTTWSARRSSRTFRQTSLRFWAVI